MERARKARKTLRVGDYVLVGSDNLKRLYWPIGKVIELIPGADNQERVAKVQIQGKNMVRPFQRLYPLEIDNASELQEQIIADEVRKSAENSSQSDDKVSQSENSVSQSDDDISQSGNEVSIIGSEVSHESEGEVSQVRTTRCGRKVTLPTRYR